MAFPAAFDEYYVEGYASEKVLERRTYPDAVAFELLQSGSGCGGLDSSDAFEFCQSSVRASAVRVGVDICKQRTSERGVIDEEMLF